MFSFREFTRSVSGLYQSRPITNLDPNPIELDQTIEGPYSVNRESVLCEKCGTILRTGYFNLHRSSGACYRTSVGKRLNNPHI
jgi:hypothetical protein